MIKTSSDSIFGVLKFERESFSSSLNIVYLLSAVVHLAFLALFYRKGVIEMQIFNYFSPLLYLGCLYLNSRGQVVTAAFLGMAEASLHGFVSTLFIGWDSGFYYYLVLTYLLVFFLFRLTLRFKLSLAGFLTLLIIWLFYFSHTRDPKYNLSPELLDVLHISNFLIMVFVLSLFSIIYTNFLRRLERDLQKSVREQKLMNQQKIKFFSVFSHDLKNPLNTLVGFTRLLWERYEKYPEDKRKEILSHIVNLTDSTSELLLNLLDWSKSQLEGIVIRPTRFNLHGIFVDLVDLFRVQREQKDLSIHLDVDDRIEVRTDKEILMTVCRNILSNAIKYSNPGGEIRVRGEIVGSELVICVSDNGVGMSVEELDALFTLDAHGSRVGTFNEKGTGLGLIVSLEYLQKCHGRIEVESAEGTGSTFTISIPLG
jgi:signal transduction histidine kinase